MYKTNDFRKGLRNIMDESKTIPKGRLYDAFLEVTERYLNEMISILNLENAVITELGEERGSELIERIATSNPYLREFDASNSSESEIEDRIKNLLAFIDGKYENVTRINGGNDKWI